MNEHVLNITEHATITANFKAVVDFRHVLEPQGDEVFDNALKCVVCDLWGNEINTLSIGGGIEKVTPEQMVEWGVNAESIVFNFAYDDYKTYGSVVGEFTGIEIGRVEAIFKINWKPTKL